MNTGRGTLMRYTKLHAQILSTILVLLEIRFVLDLIIWLGAFIVIKPIDTSWFAISLIISKVALVYLVGSWIKQLNTYYHKQFSPIK